MASLMVQNEKEGLQEEWAFLWNCQAEIYVFGLSENSTLSMQHVTVYKHLLQPRRRCDKDIKVPHLLSQYCCAYFDVAAKHKAKPPTSAINSAFSIINTKGQDQYDGVIKTLAKTDNCQELRLPPFHFLLYKTPKPNTKSTNTLFNSNYKFPSHSQFCLPKFC
jgi:hypothetical protein